jgi:hypothetical protein
MAALDSNDINIPVVQYASDKTLITVLNATHLRTQLFYRPVDGVSTGCIYGDTPAVFPAPDQLVNGSYLGQVCVWVCVCLVLTAASQPVATCYFLCCYLLLVCCTWPSCLRSSVVFTCLAPGAGRPRLAVSGLQRRCSPGVMQQRCARQTL